MDDAPFALSADLFVLRQAGIRQLLPPGQPLPGETALECEPWASFLSKVPASPVMVWTYRDLGADLSGQSNPARAALWRELLKLLDLPRGSVAFWPHSLPVGQGHAVHMDAFLAGLSRIAPQTLVVFGEDSDNLISAAVASSSHLAVSSIRVLAEPLPEEIFEGNSQLVHELAERVRLFLNPSI